MATAQIKTLQDLISALKKAGLKYIHEVKDISVPTTFVRIRANNIQQFIKLADYNFCWDIYVWKYFFMYEPRFAAVALNYGTNIAVFLRIIPKKEEKEKKEEQLGTTSP